MNYYYLLIFPYLQSSTKTKNSALNSATHHAMPRKIRQKVVTGSLCLLCCMRIQCEAVFFLISNNLYSIMLLQTIWNRHVTDRIGNILRRAYIKTISKPNKKVSQFLKTVKSNIPLQCVGVYKLDCDCDLS